MLYLLSVALAHKGRKRLQGNHTSLDNLDLISPSGLYGGYQAIQKAIDFAGPGDLVLITGKGAEQAMCVAGGKKIPWDDRVKVREALARKGQAANP